MKSNLFVTEDETIKSRLSLSQWWNLSPVGLAIYISVSLLYNIMAFVTVVIKIQAFFGVIK